MKLFSLRLVLSSALGLVLGASVIAQTPPRIPVETFFADPDCSGMQLAPDGKHVAFLATLGFGKIGIGLMNLSTGKYEPLVSARDENIKTFFWKGSDYIVYAGDIGGGESYAWRSIPIYPPKPGKPRAVVALSEAYLARYNQDANFMSIIDVLKYDPRRLLIFGRLETGGFSLGMMTIDVSDGRRTMAEGYRPMDREYDETDDVADNRGLLLARTRADGRKVLVEVRSRSDSPYERVAEFPIDRPGWELLFFAADNETLYLYNTEQSDRRTLHTLNVRTKQLSAPLFSAPEGEIDGVQTSWDRSTLYGFSYYSDKARDHFVDAGRAKLQKVIDRSLPGTVNDIVGRSKDEQILLIYAYSDRDPGTYYIFDRPNGRMGPVGKVHAAIDPAQMQPMEPVSFTARDGLVIHGYLTRPRTPAGQKVPLIINPHGGPYGVRDTWGYNSEVQFLANRGYAVLQVNYRGSWGYGHSFARAGYQEWGGKMQDDLTDAVKWAIAEGIADPARVAIYGASYGGYAALAGLVFTPELYCCGANYLGPADLSLQVGRAKSFRGDFRRSFYSTVMGDDKEYLKTRSPLNYVERLRVPLFNAYGFNDPRVDFKHWTRLEAKLKQFKKNYEILIEDDEGHGFQNEKSRITYYRRLEAFFDRHLAPVRTGVAN